MIVGVADSGDEFECGDASTFTSVFVLSNALVENWNDGLAFQSTSGVKGWAVAIPSILGTVNWEPVAMR
jgi:hypothetical protein